MFDNNLHVRAFRGAGLIAAIIGFSSLGFGFVLGVAPASAAAPFVKTQAPGFHRLMLGEFEITALNDGTVDLDVAKLLKQPQAATERALSRSFVHNPLETSVNAFLINTGARLVLIDTGAGTLFGPSLGKLQANLREAGYKPEQIDDVFITHMHPDHVGGLTNKGEPAFANAVIHANKRDSEFWLSQINFDNAPADSKSFFQGAITSVTPYRAAGRYQPFEGDVELVPGVRAIASYGHTVGHTNYLVESKGQSLLLIGDLIHVAPVQLENPDVTVAFDSDGRSASTSRQRLFTLAAKKGALVGAAHLQFPGIGHLRREAKAWRWVPLNYSAELR